MIKAETLEEAMVAINKVAQGKVLRISARCQDSTAVETNVHYPTNNSLMWDCMKTIDRLLIKLQAESGGVIRIRKYRKQAKNNDGQINNTTSSEKRKGLFEKQLKLLRISMNQAQRVLAA